MKLFTAAQFRNWDEATLASKQMTSLQLMETAAEACCKWIKEHFNNQKTCLVICGPGNNGGDGWAIARILQKSGFSIQVLSLPAKKYSADHIANRKRFKPKKGERILEDLNEIPVIDENWLVIDALFGTGLSKPITGMAAQWIKHINTSGATIISIDIPSGLPADEFAPGNPVVTSTHTLTFQLPKISFFYPEAAIHTGNIHVVDLGLDENYPASEKSNVQLVDLSMAKSLFQPLPIDAHKYNRGAALLYAGSKWMMGAAVLSATACLRSGAGVVAVFHQQESAGILPIAIPEALSSNDKTTTLWSKKKAIGFGPGLDIRDPFNTKMLKRLLADWDGPLVIDASGLGLLRPLLPLLKKRKNNAPLVLTPHTGEFDQLFGVAANSAARIKNAIAMASEYKCFLILKGHHSLIATPSGRYFFNSTGNPGMATAGSGDVLTGILTGLLAQGYDAQSACVLGVYMHGLAGDLAATAHSQPATIASDIINHLGKAYLQLMK